MARRRARSTIPSDVALAKVKDARHYPRVRVEWIDATTHASWRLIEDVRRDRSPCTSVITEGFLLRRTSIAWTLTATISDFGKALDCLSIPTRTIRRVERLR